MTDAADVTDGEAQPPVEDSTARRRWRAWVLLTRRAGLGRLAVVAVLALVVGAGVGRLTAPTGDAGARRAVETSVIPLVLDADGIWTSGADDRDPVSEALVMLRRDGNPAAVEGSLDEWLASYDAVLVRLAGLDLPSSARTVQRQFITSVTLSRDAAQVLGYAATVDDPQLRHDLTTEVGRLRQRSEQFTQAARASTLDLDGQRADVSPLPDLTPFEEGRG